jgi:hypothetical protein
MLSTLLDILAICLLALGLSVATIGLYGLPRVPDIFHQLHPNGLITGPAVILAPLASLATGSAEIITSATRHPHPADHRPALEPRDRARSTPPSQARTSRSAPRGRVRGHGHRAVR